MNNINEIPPEEFESIERYLTQQMDDKERRNFEQSLIENVQLRHNTDEIQLLLTGIQEAALQEKLKEFHREIKTAAPVRRITFVKKLLIAASVLAIISFSYWIFFSKGHQNEKLYSKYYTADPGLATVMGNSSDYDFEKAMVEYKNGEYAKAFDTWTGLLRERPGSDTLVYFVAVAAQVQHKDSIAINRLQQIVSNPGSAFYKDASWYLGLLFLKNGETKKATTLIRQSGYPNANSLLKEINNK